MGTSTLPNNFNIAEMKNILGQSKPFIIDIRELKASMGKFKETICSLKDYENLILIPFIKQLESYPINLSELKGIEIYKTEKKFRSKINNNGGIMDSGDCSKKCNNVYDFIDKFQKIRDDHLINLKGNYKDVANLALYDVYSFHARMANLYAFFDAIAAFLRLTEDNYLIRGSKHHKINFITSLEFLEHLNKINFDYPNFEDDIFRTQLFLDEMKNILGQSKPFIIDIRELKASMGKFKETICSLKDYENLILIPFIKQLESYPINLSELKGIEIYKTEKKFRSKINNKLKILEKNLIKELQEKKIELISALQKDQLLAQDSFNTPYNQPMGTSTLPNNFNIAEMKNILGQSKPFIIDIRELKASMGKFKETICSLKDYENLILIPFIKQLESYPINLSELKGIEIYKTEKKFRSKINNNGGIMDSGDCSKKCNNVYDFIDKFQKIRDDHLINLKGNYKDVANLALYDVYSFHARMANLYAFFDAIAAFLRLTEDNYLIRGSKHHKINFITSLEFLEHLNKINFDYPNFEDDIFRTQLFLDEMKNILGQSKPFIIDIRELKASMGKFKETICSLKDYENLILIPFIKQLESYPINLSELKGIEIYKTEKKFRSKINNKLKILEKNLIKELQEKKIELISALQKDQLLAQDSFNTPYNQPMGTSTLPNNFNIAEMKNILGQSKPFIIDIRELKASMGKFKETICSLKDYENLILIPFIKQLESYPINLSELKGIEIYKTEKKFRSKINNNGGIMDSGDCSKKCNNVYDFIDKFQKIRDDHLINLKVQPTIMNCLGTEFYNGGAERYVLDLAKLLIEQGYTVYCVQHSLDRPWIRNYYGLTIIGLPSIFKPILFRWSVSRLTQGAALVISSPFNLVAKEHAKKIIGISHGIFWDHPALNKQVTNILQSIKSLDRLVTVDTATLNVIRSQQIKNVDKVVFIPNYVDRKKIFPTESTSTGEELVILYPRRLYTPRGFWMVQELVPKLLHEFDFISFLFCGKAENREMDAINKLIQCYGDKVKHRVCSPDAMGAVYQQADIVLIPTLHSEGTSMSLIEAMAAKKAIIATYVGGLTDLITDRFNGLMVYPDNKDELYQAIKAFIMDKALRENMAKNAYEKSLAFDISLWKEKWSRILDSLLNEPERKLDPTRNWASDFSLIHMRAPGITFDVMVQRPQQLFKALSLLGAKCFFLEDKPGNQQQMLNKNLVVSSHEADIDFSGMIAYTYFASNYRYLKNNKPQWLIYDVLDTPDIHNCSDYLENHVGMLTTADMVITSSRLLYQEYRQDFPEKIIKYIPNAAVPSDWIPAHQCKPIDFPCYAHKTIGYYGALAEWVDYSLLDKLCFNFPDSQLLLIGPCRETGPEYKQLTSLIEKHNNLFYLGLKKYEELVYYAHYFDVGIIPHVDKHKVTQASSQVKLYEYMNVGIPIVTSDIPECRQYESAQIAKNHDEFIALVRQSLNMSKTDPYFKVMKKEAEENTWQARANCLIGAIREHFSVE
ncbi:hypothetical protein FQR65_LT11258 [Abscondita terminalis]|nr:hypothetical protein FQR65_LT11258 [Abscondita terminalis]